MSSPTSERHFQALWRRAQSAPSLKDLTPEIMFSWARERGLEGAIVEARPVGAFSPIDGVILTLGARKAFFPRISPSEDPTWLVRRQTADADAALWEKVEWFTPFWVPMGEARKVVESARHVPKTRAIELFNYHMSTSYTLAFQAVCIAQLMPKARSLEAACPLAREAYLAFYSGYRASSIAALIPAIEGAITRILPDGGGSLAVADKVDRAIDRAIATAAGLHFEGMWTPVEYRTKEFLFGQDERVFGFETFRRWLHRSFFRKTGEYDGITWLNRHLFAHGGTTEWQQSSNFSRLVVALATVGLIESWHDESHQVSLFLPEMNADSTLLHQQAQLRAQTQMAVQLIEQQRYQEHGRLVPEMPTDDGAMLRRAILSEDCIKDLVRPLRDAGWSVKVSDPEATGLYMTVVATADGQSLGAALLYSCATSNDIYRQLAETCSVILYRGAPYHEDQYAYGITAHVGSITGWQPPLAPDRTRRVPQTVS
ncbi:hypothetical protein SAMN05216304_11235 [Bosea sp. OK403]|uniref:hypothetical protein n=1 Tax=Bosea sp. OK403 TaxID=1855286 RepID=UPI0008E2AECD|nr:hypothetical protein [Bosea sp. OK403]SFJ70287.1 hypothetical protein SAMN05216304_11235 [Bosea sp. OK403]